MAKILVRDNNILAVDKEFTELTGYEHSDIKFFEAEAFFAQQLRSNYSPGSDAPPQSGDFIIFTKALEVREVKVRQTDGKSKDEYTVLMYEKPCSRIENKFMSINKTLEENVIGVGIYKIPEYILIKSNTQYLSFLGSPFDTAERAYGKRLSQIIADWPTSKIKKTFDEIIRTDRSLHMMERPGLLQNDCIRYWDNILIPVSENGHVKYLVSQLSDVTSRVMSREHISSYAKQLEAVIENMSDSLSIFDKDGNYVFLNKEAQKLFPALNIRQTPEERSSVFYDTDGNPVSYAELPINRVINGEQLRGYRLICRSSGREHHLDINGTPIFDGDGNFILGILCSQDVTERISREQQIKMQQEQLLDAEAEKRELLENALKIKDEFLYIISHEFKTPLAVISSAIQTVELVYKDHVTPKLEKYLNIIKQNTNRQLRLVNNLLDITRIGSGFTKIKRSNIDIVSLTSAIIDSVELYAMQKHIRLVFTCRFGKMNISLDEEKYERILLNLLSNAIKFTPNSKSIYVSITCVKRSKRDMICIAVKDEGIGIPKDKQEYIFERFGQADTTLTRQAEGTGIGLYLVKLLVNALDGMIELDSKTGRGSTFKVLLPVNRTSVDDQGSEEIAATLDDQSNSRLIQAAAIEFSDIYF